jgi:GrpB-like predicted nucleotidyltransferase (UPF0157 family)
MTDQAPKPAKSRPGTSKLTSDSVAPTDLGLERKIVCLVAYNPHWPEWFAAEVARLRDVLGDRIGEIEHIGSTAIPSLPAKPILDMMASVESLTEAERLIPQLRTLGYEWGPRDMEDVPDRRYFVRRREDGASTHHLSLAMKTSHFWRGQLGFRDWLRARPEVREAYARLKHELAARFPADRPAYLEGKSDFVRQVLAVSLPSI